MTRWTDAHNHLQDPRLGESAPVIAAMRAVGITRCIVNSTCEDDWAAVGGLARGAPGWALPAYGVHPWHAHRVSPGWQERLAARLAAEPQASLGEIGLDRWVASPPLDIQRAVFIDQLRMARDFQRPVTIHCLKAWGPLMEALAAAPSPPRFLMHSYGGSIELARQLIPLGGFFSISGHFLHPRKAAALEVFRQLPRERILLESDAPDMPPPAAQITHPLPDGLLNHPANLPAIGSALAAALGIGTEEFARLTRHNADTFWADREL